MKRIGKRGQIALLGGSLALILILAGIAIFLAHRGPGQWICNFPGYEQLVNGMKTTDVHELFGTPLKQIDAADETQNFYCGPGFRYHTQARQCWLYKFGGWSGRIEVFFDDNDSVVGKACGTG